VPLKSESEATYSTLYKWGTEQKKKLKYPQTKNVNSTFIRNQLIIKVEYGNLVVSWKPIAYQPLQQGVK
jgi:hypothetical protein